MSRWETLDLLEDDVPERAACYVIYLDGLLGYIGSTNNLRRRLPKHGIIERRYSATFDTKWGWAKSLKIKVNFGLRYGDWVMREMRLIRRLQPRFNTVGKVVG